MYQFETTNGSRKVITTSNGPDSVYRSRLYVNNGETATLICKVHRTERGARRWARLKLGLDY